MAFDEGNRIRMNIKRVLISFFMVMIFIVMVWFVFQAIKPVVLPIGSRIPDITYYDGNISKALASDSAGKRIIMLFHEKCHHCEYQMQQLNENIEKFKDIEIYLFTTNNDFYAKGCNKKKWPNLYNSQNVKWGIVSNKELYKKFGRFVFPTTFIFDDSAKLCQKLKGEVKLQKIFNGI